MSCRILVDKLRQDHGLEPGPLYKELTQSPIVTLSNGKKVGCRLAFRAALIYLQIRSADYMTAPRPGRKIVILGDTCDATGIAELAMDADVVVHESTCSESERSAALQHYHSTASMAGSFAKAIRAKHLILTHFSPRNFHSNECRPPTSLGLLY